VTVLRTPNTFDIDPNPHNNPDYNNDGQAKFYRAAALAVVKGFQLEQTDGLENELGKGDAVPKFKDWTKLTAKKQADERDKYNEQVRTRNKAKIAKDRTDQVVAHFTRGDREFKFGNVDYTVKKGKKG
jgi:hypothetical protein